MADHRALVPALSQFARRLVRDYDVDEVLDCFCHQVVAVLGTSGAGVSLVDAAGVLRLVAATDDHIEQIENLQTSLRDGPCFEAYRLGTPVAVEDPAASDRWPGFAEGMVEAGLHAVAGVPMAVGGQRIGALAVYSQQPRRFGQDDLEVAQTLASVAT
ncbi:MAG: GAF domain-containing protein, partial [Actinomycetota bacterium]|nr:GAF domain-containing protein [Actinomycetota bacterium]